MPSKKDLPPDNYDENFGIEDDLGVDDIGGMNTASPGAGSSVSSMYDDGGFGLGSTYEDYNTGVSEGVVRWVFDPSDIFDSFEMYLRGLVFDKSSKTVKQLYRGYYIDPKTQQKVKVPYRLMNERGINDAMGILRSYVSRVTSFSQYNIDEINIALRVLLFDTLARYIVYKNVEFGIAAEDGYHIPFKMYDLIRSGWLQGYKGKSLNLLGKNTRISEVIGGKNTTEKKPKWQFWSTK
jgi:hypothetical protein